MPSERFTKARRVRRRGEFKRVFDLSLRMKGRYLTVLMAPNAAGTRRLGIVASRKLGDAVRRNRAKRLIRDIFRRTDRHRRFGAGATTSSSFPGASCSMRAFASLEAGFSRRGQAMRRPAARLLVTCHPLSSRSRSESRLPCSELYKVAFSPMYAGSCRFVPSCSDYAAEAVARHGVVRGSCMAARRLARCHPFGASGLDPVPGAGARDQITTINGKTGSSRGRPVVCRPVRLPGAVSAAKAAAQGRSRDWRARGDAGHRRRRVRPRRLRSRDNGAQACGRASCGGARRRHGRARHPVRERVGHAPCSPRAAAR